MPFVTTKTLPISKGIPKEYLGKNLPKRKISRKKVLTVKVLLKVFREIINFLKGNE